MTSSRASGPLKIFAAPALELRTLQGHNRVRSRPSDDQVTSCDPTGARRRPWAASALGVAGMLALSVVGPAQRVDTKTGVPFNGVPAVGALFTQSHGKLGKHFCTASVVHSLKGDLLVTAAHCMTGRRLKPAGSIEFAPGYHLGKFPAGKWPVTRVYVDHNWSARHDPNDDVAFLVVTKPGKEIEKYTGAEQLAVNQKPPVTVRVIGYPDAKSRPITCTNTARAYDRGKLRQLVFNCDDYTDGTSGGPFLTRVSRKTRDGHVVGVIGGYQQGGDSPDISYSPRFGSNVLALYKTATGK
jgi:V8-like Glu-specific endopeptidase